MLQLEYASYVAINIDRVVCHLYVLGNISSNLSEHGYVYETENHQPHFIDSGKGATT